MTQLSLNPIKPGVEYFERLVAKAILWKRTERLVTEQQFGGYRANIVAYAIAKLSHSTAQRIDLGRIWSEQALDPTLEAPSYSARTSHGRCWSTSRRPE